MTPLNRDAFNVADIDHAASAFPELNFIVEHVGLKMQQGYITLTLKHRKYY
ncbi:hypothetical protein LIT25_13045 [Bacillus sp. F19]|nr:hypothetical protein LIT25_13045 [Bacillus sp. F19]